MSSPIFNKQNYDASVATLRVVSFVLFCFSSVMIE